MDYSGVEVPNALWHEKHTFTCFAYPTYSEKNCREIGGALVKVIKAYATSKAQLTAVFDIDAEANRAVAAQFGAVASESMAELLGSGVNAVYIAIRRMRTTSRRWRWLARASTFSARSRWA